MVHTKNHKSHLQALQADKLTKCIGLDSSYTTARWISNYKYYPYNTLAHNVFYHSFYTTSQYTTIYSRQRYQISSIVILSFFKVALKFHLCHIKPIFLLLDLSFRLTTNHIYTFMIHENHTLSAHIVSRLMPTSTQNSLSFMTFPMPISYAKGYIYSSIQILSQAQS